MDINNPTGVPLEILDLTVFWNHDGGHQNGSDKTLRLRQVDIISASGTETIWIGNVYSTSYNIIGDGLLLPTGPSTIVFTFHQTYQNIEGSERIFINLATNGCQNFPIDSNN